MGQPFIKHISQCDSSWVSVRPLSDLFFILRIPRSKNGHLNTEFQEFWDDFEHQVNALLTRQTSDDSQKRNLLLTKPQLTLKRCLTAYLPRHIGQGVGHRHIRVFGRIPHVSIDAVHNAIEEMFSR